MAKTTASLQPRAYLTRYLIDLADFWHVVLEWCPKY